ncbi:MAG: hypothetical protein ACREMO_06135, partial [Gemmatimonadales bacterium]
MHGDLIPILGMLIGLAISGGFIVALIKIAQGPIGLALSRRIQGQAGEDPELHAEVAFLREQVESIRHQLNDTQERLDFTER